MSFRALFAFLVWAGIGYAAVMGLNKIYDESRLIGQQSQQPVNQAASPVGLPDRVPTQH